MKSWPLQITFGLLWGIFVWGARPCICTGRTGRDPKIIPALGREATLGELYNEESGVFLKSTIFNSSDTPDSENMVSTFHPNRYDTSLTPVSSLQEKWEQIGMDGRSLLELLSGKIERRGSLKYLGDINQKKSTRDAEGLLQFNMRTIGKSLDLFSEVTQNWISLDTLNTTRATHFVVSVDYGVDVFVQLIEREQDGDKARDKLNQLNHHLNALFDTESEIDVTPLANYTCHIFGDISHGPIYPQKIHQVFTYLASIPYRMTSKFHGVPKTYTLVSIHDIRVKMGVTQTSDSRSIPELPSEGETEIIRNLTLPFQDMAETREVLFDLQEEMRRSLGCVPSNLVDRIGRGGRDMEASFFKFKTRLRHALSYLPTSPNFNLTFSLIQVHSDYKSSPFYPTAVVGNLKNDFELIKRRISSCKMFRELVSNEVIQFYWPERDKIFSNIWWDSADAYVLHFKQTWADDLVVGVKWNKNYNHFLHSLSGETQKVIVDCDLGMTGSACAEVDEPKIYRYQNGVVTSIDVVGMADVVQVEKKVEQNEMDDLKRKLATFEARLNACCPVED